jgi:SAM-dependent methyltransferase
LDDVGFYRHALEELLQTREIAASDAVVVFCGGYNDAKVLGDLGFSNVTITNVDARNEGNIRGLAWESQDAENPTYPDGKFDIAIVHAGLHHCHSPHRALLQMYRVARKAVVVFEARDSLAMRVAEVIGFTPEFELEAISDDGETGGVANGPVPNFIYRWTEREVEKTVRSFDPAYVDKIRYFYGLNLPTSRLEKSGAHIKRVVLRLLTPVAWGFWRIFPKQGNQFGFAIIKTGRLRNWLEDNGGKIRLSREKA